MTPAIRIQARSPRGHRRCGLRHPAQPVLHPPGAFSPEDFRTLCDDPRLLVEIVGDLAMGALSGPEIATMMADAFQEGAVLTGWEAHAPLATPEGDVSAGGDADGGPTPSVPGEQSTPDAGKTEGGEPEDATAPTPRTRKAKEA